MVSTPENSQPQGETGGGEERLHERITDLGNFTVKAYPLHHRRRPRPSFDPCPVCDGVGFVVMIQEGYTDIRVGCATCNRVGWVHG